jgi:hypothetical protein
MDTGQDTLPRAAVVALLVVVSLALPVQPARARASSTASGAVPWRGWGEVGMAMLTLWGWRW